MSGVTFQNESASTPPRGTQVKTTLTADGHVQHVSLDGMSDSGENLSAAFTTEGHLEVALHAPRLPFGSVHTESLHPIFQTDAVYGINAGLVSTSVSGTGSATASDSSFIAATGATQYSQGSIQSRKRLRYRAGQGIVGRFTAMFTAPVAQSYQVAGFGHAEDGVFFGYASGVGQPVGEFGILYSTRGVREVQTLTVTVGATSAANATITLNSVAYTVPLTNASSANRTAYDIATFSTGYAGWKAEAVGATVVFVADAVGNKTLTFSFGAGTTGASASFSETLAGAAATETFIPQSTWNGDKLDGTGRSGFTIVPTKYNVFQIKIQYLGAGSIVFEVEVTPPNGNNSEWVVAHTMRLPNTLTEVSFGNPSFPFTMAVYSAGSTTNLTLKCGSFAGFVEGQKMLHGNRFSYYAQSTAVDASSYRALFTVQNTRYYGGRSNQAVINLLSASGALKHTSPCIFYLIRGGALVGNPNFTRYATNSCSLVDTTATAVTFSTNDQIIWSGHLGDTGEFDHHFNSGIMEVTLQPGEWVTLAAKATTGTPAYVTGSINTREDQ